MAFQYSSCPHLNSELIQNAIELCKTSYYFNNKLNLLSSYICIQCKVIGSISSNQFINHCKDENHCICMRMRDPIELYCIKCHDYQFSSEFDKQLHKNKRISSIMNRSNHSKATTDSHNTASTNSTTNASAVVIASNVKNNNNNNKKNKVLNLTYPSSINQKRLKGYCNMGATCFMNAILQICTRNIVLLNCKEMQISLDSCIYCPHSSTISSTVTSLHHIHPTTTNIINTTTTTTNTTNTNTLEKASSSTTTTTSSSSSSNNLATTTMNNITSTSISSHSICIYCEFKKIIIETSSK